MFKTEISVIIPVFRIRNYLRPCIESVLMQDFDLPFNIMLIETGSDDGSDAICHEYEMKYPGKVYHFHYDKNVGISFARNLGILHANGKYIAFVDGDDVLKKGFLSRLYHQMENDTDLQVIFGGYDFLYDDGMTKKARSPIFYGNGKRALRTFYKSYAFYRGYCWGGLFKRDFLLLNHLCFDCEMKLYEDMLFLYEALYLANKVSFNDESLYLYRKHDGSTMAIHHDWLDYHLKCLKKFQSFLKSDKASIRYFSKPTKALKRQLKLDCWASSMQGTNPKKLYRQTIRKFKR
jgi:glycosyltransferase involved in cell wall biosynthesis